MQFSALFLSGEMISNLISLSFGEKRSRKALAAKSGKKLSNMQCVRVIRSEKFSLHKMSVRERFLNDFTLLSLTLKENISIYFISDFGNALAITFSELNILSDKLSIYFLKIFEKDYPYIGVFVKDYFFLPCLILAIWKSGKTFSGIGKQYSRADTLYYLNCLKVKYIITDINSNEYSDKLKSEFYIQDKKFFIWERHELKNPINNGLKEICYGIMTSGTTREPKIIHVPWNCILLNAVELSEKFDIKTSDCMFLASPCSFDPFFIELFMMLLKGCSLMIVLDTVKLESKNLLKILFTNVSNDSNSSFEHTLLNIVSVEKDNYFNVDIKKVKKPCITALQMTPSFFKLWSDSEIKECILSFCSSLRILVLGGEPFPKNILKLKHAENKTRIFNIYGITEISCWAFLNEVTHLPLQEEISLGKPLESIKYKISDNGELYLGSNSRMCFIENELNEFGTIVFRKTNDIVRLDKENIYYLGRSNQIIKKYGIKINLTKIENSFVNVKIKECHCVYNEDCKRLGLFFVPVNKSCELNYKLITYEEFCKCYGPFTTEELSDIEKPDCFVEILEPPLNYHGKIDKKVFLDYLAGGQKSFAPITDLKTVFRNQWIEVLDLKMSNLSSENFMKLGGSSLMALQLINKLTDAGFKVPQNLIGLLLNGESFDSCFKSFELALKRDEKIVAVTRKRQKTCNDMNVGVKLIVRWKFGLGKCIDATPSVFTYEREERVVVGSHSSKLSCINASTGREIWTVSLGGRIESGFRINKDKTKGFIGCYDNFVYCIALSDGTFIWKFKTGDMVKSTPCLSSDEKILYVASYDTKLYCLVCETGEALHVLKLSDGGIYCSGSVSHSLKAFYIGTLNGTCLSIDQETNQIIWKIVLGSPVFATPCLLESKNEIIFSEVLGIVHCLNALNGTEVWKFKADSNIYSSPVAHQSSDAILIVFGCHDKNLYCLKYDRVSELKWKCLLDSSIFGKPLVVLKSQNVCTASTKGFVYLCDLSTGAIRGRLKLDGEIFSSVVHCGSRLFVGCRDDNIYCLEAEK